MYLSDQCEIIERTQSIVNGILNIKKSMNTCYQFRIFGKSSWNKNTEMEIRFTIKKYNKLQKQKNSMVLLRSLSSKKKKHLAGVYQHMAIVRAHTHQSI